MNHDNLKKYKQFESDFERRRFFQAITTASSIYNQLKYSPEFTRKMAVCYLMVGSTTEALRHLNQTIKSALKSNKYSDSDIAALQCFWAKIKLISYLNLRSSDKYLRINEILLKPSAKKEKLMFLAYYSQENNINHFFNNYIEQLFDFKIDEYLKDVSFKYENKIYFFVSGTNDPNLPLKLFLIAKYYHNHKKYQKSLELLNSINNSLSTDSDFRKDINISIKRNLEKIYSINLIV